MWQRTTSHLALFLKNNSPCNDLSPSSLPLSPDHYFIRSSGLPRRHPELLAHIARWLAVAASTATPAAFCCSRVYSYRLRFLHWLSVGDKTASLQRYAASAAGLSLSSWATASCVTYSPDCQFTSKHSTATHSLVPAYYIGPHLAQHPLHDSISLSTCDVR